MDSDGFEGMDSHLVVAKELGGEVSSLGADGVVKQADEVGGCEAVLRPDAGETAEDGVQHGGPARQREQVLTHRLQPEQQQAAGSHPLSHLQTTTQ